MKRHYSNSILFSLAFAIFIVSFNSCKKKPFNDLNKYVGEWHFTAYDIEEKVVEIDSNGIATEYEETRTDRPEATAVVRVRNSEELYFDFGDVERVYRVDENGAIRPTEENEWLYKASSLSGEFIGTDSVVIRNESWGEYVYWTRFELGSRVD